MFCYLRLKCQLRCPQAALFSLRLGIHSCRISWSILPLPLQFSEYIHAQVASGKGKLAPGFDAEMIVKNMFTNQDRNGDGKVTAEEFKLKDQEAKHDEL